jgi:hypothetical protein
MRARDQITLLSIVDPTILDRIKFVFGARLFVCSTVQTERLVGRVRPTGTSCKVAWRQPEQENQDKLLEYNEKGVARRAVQN